MITAVAATTSPVAVTATSTVDNTKTAVCQVTVNSAEGEVTVTKTVATLKTEKGWTNQQEVPSFDLGQVTVTMTGSNGTTKYYDYGSNLRIYLAKNGGTGSVKFDAKEGYKIVSVKLTYGWANNHGEFPIASGTTQSVDKTTVTYAITNDDSSTAEGQTEQLRITAFEIVYTAVSAS